MNLERFMEPLHCRNVLVEVPDEQMVIIITKLHLVEFANFRMVKFITICNHVKITPGKMVE